VKIDAYDASNASDVGEAFQPRRRVHMDDPLSASTPRLESLAYVVNAW